MSLFTEAPPTANDMAEIMGCSRQSVKEILNSLEKKGFVELIPDEKDRRKKLICMTKKAGELRDKYSAREIEFINGLYDGLTKDEIRETYRVISHMEDNLIGMSEGTV